MYSTRSEWYTLKSTETILFENSIPIANPTIIVDDEKETVRFNISMDTPDDIEQPIRFCYQMISSNGGFRGGSGGMINVEGDHYTVLIEELREEQLEGMEFWIVIMDSKNQFHTTEYYKIGEEDIR